MLVALFVVFLWATSWVLIKFGLEAIPPLTFAGLRYVITAGAVTLLALHVLHLRHIGYVARASFHLPCRVAIQTARFKLEWSRRQRVCRVGVRAPGPCDVLSRVTLSAGSR